MKKLLPLGTSLLLCVFPYQASAEQNWGETLSQAVKDSTVSADLRYRLETVDQDGFDEDAEASLLRSRVSLTTGSVEGLFVNFEVDNVTSIGVNNYDSTENGETDYPVIADPEYTEINQAWLGYTSGDQEFRGGRQRILHGNQRFVGGVGWRQNEQTYDGFRAEMKLAEKVGVDVGYVYNVNRIFGPRDGANPADWEGDNFLVRVSYALNDSSSLTGFAYLVDVEDQGRYAAGKTVNNSTDTFGVEYQGTYDFLSLHASYASQSDAGDSELDFDSNYYFVEAAAAFDPVTLKAGYEVLAADNGVGFKTPLATLHKFQGWADKFLTTPGDGIEDLYLAAGSTLGSVALLAVYHDFQAESSSVDFGTEIDLSATWKLNKQLSLQVKYADFDSDNAASYDDTEKLWLTAQIKL